MTAGSVGSENDEADPAQLECPLFCRYQGKTGRSVAIVKTTQITLTGPPVDQQLKPTVGHFTLAARSQSARLDIERKGLLSEGTCIVPSSSRFSAQWQSGRSLRRRSERRLFASV